MMKLQFVKWVGAACLVLASIEPRAQIILGFDPASQSVEVGSSVSVGVTIAGLGANAAPSLGGFDLNISFDPGVLSFTGAAFGDPLLGEQLDLGFGSSPLAGAVSPGVAEIFEVSFAAAADLNALQAGSFTLATLTFNAVGSGNSPLGIAINSLADADGNSLAADTGNGAIVVNRSASAPEPGILTLLAAGFLAGFAGRSRRGNGNS